MRTALYNRAFFFLRLATQRSFRIVYMTIIM